MTFVKGDPRINREGRPKGSLDFKTKWLAFVDKVATANNMTAEEINEQLLAVGFKKAKEGDYSFYRDIFDRIYGRPVQPTDITSDGEKIDITNSKAMEISKEYEEKIKRGL